MSNQNFTIEDSGQNRVLGVVMSIFPILFFIPLIGNNNSVYLRFRANQTLLQFIFGIAVAILSKIPYVGWIVGIAGGLIELVIAIMNIVNAATEQTTGKTLPIIGQIEIIK